jgi:hypothetical protein
MLAYLFWHWPRPDVDPGRYADALLAFHRALSASPPPGYRGSRVLEVSGAAWAPGSTALEDWYFVDDFAALGALNEAAVSGQRRVPHEGAARLAQGGAGGVYRRVREAAAAEPAVVAWFGKPAELGYPELLARVPPAELWQRQLVLGPAPEFCLFGAAPPEGAEEPSLVRVRLLHDSASSTTASLPLPREAAARRTPRQPR